MLADFENLRELPIAEKLRVVEALWDDIIASKEEFPISLGLRNEVEQRLSDLAKHSADLMTREEVWRRVDEQRG